MIVGTGVMGAGKAPRGRLAFGGGGGDDAGDAGLDEAGVDFDEHSFVEPGEAGGVAVDEYLGELVGFVSLGGLGLGHGDGISADLGDRVESGRVGVAAL